jgi:hypothetical protein
MSKKPQTFGVLAGEIIIKADNKGLVIVEAWDYPQSKAIVIAGTPHRVAMDSRQMVLALQKVTADYCAALFGMMGNAPTANSESAGATDGEKDHRNNDAG